MPFHDKEIKDEITGEVKEVVKEKFLPFFLGDTKEEAAKIERSYKDGLRHLARKFARKSGVDQKDLYQEGLIGLARAMRDFRTQYGKKARKNPRFHTFAVFMMRNALREAVYVYDSPISVPAYLRETGYYVSRLRDVLRNITVLSMYEQTLIVSDYKVDPIDFGVKEPYLGMIEDWRRKINNRARAASTDYEDIVEKAISLPRQFFADIYTFEFREAVEELPDERLDAEDALERLSRVLSKQEYDVLVRHQVDEEKVIDLADEYGLTSGRISQMLNEAREKVKKNRKFIVEGVK